MERPARWKHQPLSLQDKRIIVTGGTTGIGRTTALLLAGQGARVLIFGRNPDALEDALQDMSEYPEHVFGLTADVSREDDVDRVFDEADRQLGGLDILINNAGVSGKGVLELEPEDYRYVIETNLVGCMACAKRAVPRMQLAGGGTIINVGSLSAEERGENSDVYVASKSGLRGFSISLGKRVEADDINVVLIEPGSVGADLNPRARLEEIERHEQGKMLFSESIAEAVLYCLTQPRFCRITLLQIQPLHQKIGS
jgi:NAD(P)-dependent dehydrogenase (short-subunit alcohol dehydrogenase family)